MSMFYDDSLSTSINRTDYVPSHVVARTPSEQYQDIGRSITSAVSASCTKIAYRESAFIVVIDGSPLIFKLDFAVKNDTEECKTSVPDSEILNARLDDLKNRLSLSMTQIAELFGVTRKTVYDWYEGSSPRPDKLSRIDLLMAVISQAPSTIDVRRLKNVWSIEVSGSSFLSLLGDEGASSESIKAQLLGKLDELRPRLVTAPAPTPKASSKLGESNSVEFDRFADLG